MIKAICFDLDGVVLKKRDKFFSEKLSERFGIPLEQIIPFFKNEYKEIVVGKMELKEILGKYILTWGLDIEIAELLDYWFLSENDVDNEVVEQVKNMKAKGFGVYLASDHTKERAENVRKSLGFSEKFDGDFFSYEIGYTKESVEYFEELVKRLGIIPSEIMLIDDDQNNLEFAKSVGLKTLHFDNLSMLAKELNNLNIDSEISRSV